jgi:hypothetical protein
MMLGLTIWLAAYFTPAATSWFATFFLTRKKGVGKYNLLLIHIALLISILMSHYAITTLGLVFPWHLSVLSLSYLVLAMVFAMVLIGISGFWYTISALIQEFSMLSMAFILLSFFPLWMVTFLIAPVFVGAHFLSTTRWQVRLALLSLWSAFNIPLFYLTYDIYLIAAIHTVLGAFFISRSIMLFNKNVTGAVWLR